MRFAEVCLGYEGYVTVLDAASEALIITFSATFLLSWVWGLGTALC